MWAFHKDSSFLDGWFCKYQVLELYHELHEWTNDTNAVNGLLKRIERIGMARVNGLWLIVISDSVLGIRYSGHQPLFTIN
jgi:hypothetical protein